MSLIYTSLFCKWGVKMAYSLTILEEDLKNKVARDYFSGFDYSIHGKIDFCVSQKVQGIDYSFLWAEAKSGTKHNIYESFVQLILTIGKARTFEKLMPPSFIGAFDAEKIAFIPYHVINEVFFMNDFNWNVTPSNYETKEFKHLYSIVEKSIEENLLKFTFGEDDKQLKEFIKENFVYGKNLTKIDITKNNFTSVYFHWLKEVKPTITNVDWREVKKYGIVDADFYLADLLSNKNETIKEKLYVLLKTNAYEYDEHFHQGRLFVSRASFSDGQKAHTQFWNKYNRPPREEFWDYILKRRDLLVPQDIRERKGSYFTPQCWVELSQKYMADYFGEDWQEEYYIWDCAAGTGNLLVGLNDPARIWASTIDEADVKVMKDCIKSGTINLLENHVFQFDFLNDDFSKCPVALQNILNDEEKRKKLIVYINPPYAEPTTKTTVIGTGKNKSGVAKSKIKERYEGVLRQASKELFVQFMFRVYKEIPNAYLANFSKLKNLQGTHHREFRENFLAKLEKLFIVPAYTFDNVDGIFPIGFYIWNTQEIQKFESVYCDIYDEDSNKIGRKEIVSYDNEKTIKDWLRTYKTTTDRIAYLVRGNSDIQDNNRVYITLQPSAGILKASNASEISAENLVENCIFLATRKVIEPTWINDRDLYIHPQPSWEKDDIFKTDCLTHCLFNNNIQSEHGVNHWIPFTELEVGAKEAFESNFMTKYMKGKLKPKTSSKTAQGSLLAENTESRVPTEPLVFSDEAKAVFDAGRELWKYYHSQPNANPNASLYDIKKCFQGVNSKGKMNKKSEDFPEYNILMDNLRDKLKILAAKIEPKVYEHGFLLK